MSKSLFPENFIQEEIEKIEGLNSLPVDGADISDSADSKITEPLLNEVIGVKKILAFRFRISDMYLSQSEDSKERDRILDYLPRRFNLYINYGRKYNKIYNNIIYGNIDEVFDLIIKYLDSNKYPEINPFELYYLLRESLNINNMKLWVLRSLQEKRINLLFLDEDIIEYIGKVHDPQELERKVQTCLIRKQKLKYILNKLIVSPYIKYLTYLQWLEGVGLIPNLENHHSILFD